MFLVCSYVFYIIKSSLRYFCLFFFFLSCFWFCVVLTCQLLLNTLTMNEVSCVLCVVLCIFALCILRLCYWVHLGFYHYNGTFTNSFYFQAYLFDIFFFILYFQASFGVSFLRAALLNLGFYSALYCLNMGARSVYVHCDYRISLWLPYFTVITVFHCDYRIQTHFPSFVLFVSLFVSYLCFDWWVSPSHSSVYPFCWFGNMCSSACSFRD